MSPQDLLSGIGSAYLARTYTVESLEDALERGLQLGRCASAQTCAAILDQLVEGVLITDATGRISRMNRAATQISGRPEAEALGATLAAIGLEGIGAITETHAHDTLLIRRDGTQRVVSLTITPLHAKAAAQHGAVIVLHDVTEQRQAAAQQQRIERKLCETQRMESLGLLAGGIAHDFNNLLSFVLGYAELACAEVPHGSTAGRYLDQVLDGGRRANNLIRQLLSYSGKGTTQSQLINVNTLISEMQPFIQATIGRCTPITFAVAPERAVVAADPTQITQVVLNMLSNAAEAMEERNGSVHLSTGSIMLTAADLRTCPIGAEQPPGQYAYLRVVDQGTGIDAATLAQIFDPFFTTKPTGHGLGLAAVQHILQSHGGALNVVSEPGAGTTFTIFLPLHAETQHDAPPPQTDTGARPAEVQQTPAQRGTLLVVDDDESVRMITTRMLERLGYNVQLAPSGATALALLEDGMPGISGVILDLTLPDIAGTVVAQAILARRQDMPIIMMSGYNAEEAAQAVTGRPGFLQKPFTQADLAQALERLNL